MTTPSDTSAGAQLLAAAGMKSTTEGRQRAKDRLRKAHENFTEEQRAELAARPAAA